MTLRIATWLAAFAGGAIVLETRPSLPPMPVALFAASTWVTIGAIVLDVRTRRVRRQARARVATALAAVASLAGAALLGFAYAALRAEVRLADALPALWEERDVRVLGIVDDLPQPFANGVRFVFEVHEVETRGAIVPRHVSLAWFAPRVRNEEESRAATVDEAAAVTKRAAWPPVPVVHAGECWSLTVRLKRPHGNVNPHGFDLEAWLLEHDLRATGYVRESTRNERSCAFAGRFGDHVQRARERIRARIAAALPDARYAGVVTALTIGDQRAIPEAQWSVFNRTGVTHLVSISGLHVTVFATLAGACALALARRSTALTSRVPARKIGVAVGVVFALAYVLLAGAEVPAVRTFLMLAVAAAGLWLGRPGTALCVWSWSLAAVLVWDPWASLAPGFWLSFGAVGLLLYAGSGRLDAPAPTLRTRCVATLREAARAQWVVTIGLVPGTLALFQQVSVVSALANAVAIPVVTLGVVPLALLPLAVPIDACWQLAHAVLAVLMAYLEWLAASPFAAWASHAPLPWTVAVAVVGIGWWLAPRGVPGRALGVVLLCPLALVPPPGVSEGGVRITVLDVGQGLAVFVATARHTLVYDTGPRVSDTVDAGSRVVLPFLRAAGVRQVNALVVSHADSDHAGGAASILANANVDRLLSSLPAGHPLLARAGRAAPPARCVAGERWSWDGVTFTILHPAAADYDDRSRRSNDLSCVLKIDAASGSILLTGDIEAPAEDALVQRNREALRADVLVVPHHGSRTSSTRDFVAAVAPRVAAIAAGYRNRFGHPREDVLARYRQLGAQRLRTDLQGAITVMLDGTETPMDAYGERERHRRYWYDPPSHP